MMEGSSGICEENELKRKMILATGFLSVGFTVLLPIFIATGNAVVEGITITVGITLYHFAMRLAVGTIVNRIMKNNADHRGAWFREKGFERQLYTLLRVRKWKRHIPTYSPETFDTDKKTVREIVGATCQAEIVHEVIMVLSLLPIAAIPLLGGATAILITSFLSMLIDWVFVILQRYNRPRLVRLMGRWERLR